MEIKLTIMQLISLMVLSNVPVLIYFGWRGAKLEQAYTRLRNRIDDYIVDAHRTLDIK